MEWARLKDWHVCWNRIDCFSRLDLNGVYKGNIHPLYVSLYGFFKKG